MASLDSSKTASEDLFSPTAKVPYTDKSTPLMVCHSIELRLRVGLEQSRVDPDTIFGRQAGPWIQVAGDLTFYDGKKLRIENAHVSNGNGRVDHYTAWPALAGDGVLEIELSDVAQYDQGFSLSYPDRDELGTSALF